MTTIEEQRAMVRKVQNQFNARGALLGVRKTQEQISTRAPARGGVWISQDSFRTAEISTNLHDILQQVILDLSTPTVVHLPMPMADNEVSFEWIGQQKGRIDSQAPLTDDKEIFERLCADADNDVTILYAHGGAF